MTASSTTGSPGAGADLVFDPYDAGIVADPYPLYRRLRDEAPLYYNETHDFYAVSRFDDVHRVLMDPATFISGKGAILEVIRLDTTFPGVLMFEDPPIHTVHRKLLARLFTPRAVADLEPQIREFCARSLDPHVGSGGFDFIANLGAEMPMRVIGMLLGIPEEEQAAVRDSVDAALRTQDGKPMERSGAHSISDMFADFVDERMKHPTEDLMSQLIQAEFTDETGTDRRLTREELLLYLAVLAGAGNETTGRLIGWAGKTLSDHPDQRRDLAADFSLIPNAIEEILRFEPPGPFAARVVSREVEIHGTTLPKGAVVEAIMASGNRDERRYGPTAEQLDIRRADIQHFSFGQGIHFCLGNALARLEGRVALEEILTRFPDWEVDAERARLATTSTVRGWETLPVLLP